MNHLPLSNPFENLGASLTNFIAGLQPYSWIPLTLVVVGVALQCAFGGQEGRKNAKVWAPVGLIATFAVFSAPYIAKWIQGFLVF